MKNLLPSYLLFSIFLVFFLTTCAPIDPTLVEDFENYKLDASLSEAASDHWQVSSGVGIITQLPGNSNQVLKIEGADDNQPHILLKPVASTSDICRLSWDILVEKDYGAYCNLLLTGDISEVAYHIYFESGLGRITRAGETNGLSLLFPYVPGVMSNFTQIFDRNNGCVEFWIDGIMIGRSCDPVGAKQQKSWLPTLNFVGPIRKYGSGGAGSLYYLDNITLAGFGQSCAGTKDFKPVCVNGQRFDNPAVAKCSGYTKREWVEGECNPPPQNTICDLSGILIDNGLRYTNSIGPTSYPMSILKSFSCKDFSSVDSSANLFFDVFVYLHDQSEFEFEIEKSSKKVDVFAFRCDCKPQNPDRPSMGSFCQPVCIMQSKEGKLSLSQQAPGYYFIMIAGEKDTEYTFSSTPPGACSIDPITLECGKEVSGILAGQKSNFRNCSWLITHGDTDPKSCLYDNTGGCYNGDRTYEGPDTLYRFEITGTQKVTIILEADPGVGIFLYGSKCGEDCIAYAETYHKGTAPQAVMVKELQSGTYYLVLDKNEPGGTARYQLSLNCEKVPMIPFVQGRKVLPDIQEKAPVSYNAQRALAVPLPEVCSFNMILPGHRMNFLALANTSLGLVDMNTTLDVFDYYIEFFYNDEHENERSFGVNNLWNPFSPPNSTFYLDGDPPELKCSYVLEDTFIVKIARVDNTTPGRPNTAFAVAPQFHPAFDKSFRSAGNSYILRFKEFTVCSLKLDPSYDSQPLAGGPLHLGIITGGEWTLTIDDPWIQLDPVQTLTITELVPGSEYTGVGTGVVNLIINPSSTARNGSLTVQGPCNLNQTLRIEQL